MNQSSETNLEQLQSLLTNGTGSTADLNQLIDPLLTLLQLAIVAGLILSAILLLYFIVNLVQKQRTHNAILRIDKNLQLLVDAQEQKQL